MDDHHRIVNRNTTNELSSRYSPLTSGASEDEPEGCLSRIPLLTIVATSFLFGICVAVEAILLSTGVLLPNDNYTFVLNFGSAVSIVSCASVVFNYTAVVSSRRHPSPIIFFRTLVNGGYAAVIFVLTLKQLLWGYSVDCASATGAFESMLVQFTGKPRCLCRFESICCLHGSLSPSFLCMGCSHSIGGLVSDTDCRFNYNADEPLRRLQAQYGGGSYVHAPSF